MEYIDLKTQYNILKDTINSNIQKVLNDNSFISGSEVVELEKQLAEFVSIAHCITVGNGTDALMMPLMAWNIGSGDAVFVPTFTFMATAEVVSLRGATPVFVDIERDTFNIDPASLEFAIQKILKKGKLTPKVIIPVDLFGLPADYQKIELIAKKYGIKILEDGAQGFGGSINGKKVCSFGDVATTSFFPAKPLGCYGDGGAIFTCDDNLADILRSIRVHGKGKDKYDNIRIGLNSRLDTLQAAILLPKFKAFKDYELDARNKWAKLYSELLCDVVKVPFIPEGYISSWAQYTIWCKSAKERDTLQLWLKEKDIPTMLYYKKPLHLQGAYENLGYRIGDFPVAEEASNCVLSLPMHPYMNEEQVNYISEQIHIFFGKQNEYKG